MKPLEKIAIFLIKNVIVPSNIIKTSWAAPFFYKGLVGFISVGVLTLSPPEFLVLDNFSSLKDKEEERSLAYT